MTIEHDWRHNFLITRFGVKFTPIVNQKVSDNHPLWKIERKTRAFWRHHEKFKFLAKFSVIALFCLFNHIYMFLQLFLIWISIGVDALKHLILLASSPIRAVNCVNFKSVVLQVPTAFNMRPSAQIKKVVACVV